MNSILYSSRTIETKYFLLSNLKSKKKYSGFVRTQEFGCSNYYGEEVKNPIYEKNIKSIISTPRNIINPIKLFDTNNNSKISNKSVSLRESCKLVLNSKNNKGLQAKFNKNN